ncbi:mannosylglycoprotein endo-beta-mannosidase [Quercus suber]|uniref:Mannosylglycoprotein endo-beta-mannosidase n=1 Tax=Quercus suber TaxID=58331 RepID=A0AAW0KE58_QUESU
MFQRHSLDVTDILHPDGQNLLAFPVHLPDHPGRILHKGGQGVDHEIGKDVATQYVLGWDWMAPIRDRNTGIWDEVSVSITGRVKIIDPHLVSLFFDEYKRVYLHATTELENRSAWVAVCSLIIQCQKILANILMVHVFTSKDPCGMDLQIHGFSAEVGSVGIAVADTIRATMSQEGWQIPLFKQLPSGY